MTNTLNFTHFQFPKQTHFYRGKVREVYSIADELLVMIASDRLSAFDVILPKQIPFKGQLLNQIAIEMLAATKEIVPNWIIESPDPNVSIGRLCTPFKVEMVIRGYLTGHAARTYKTGERMLCGVSMPNGMIENQDFPSPIITPATKAEEGHDEDISREEIIARKIISEKDYEKLEFYTQALFKKGSEIADQRGLILVDTKYEFGKTKEGEIILIDEIHTPDSSRYFYKDGYLERQEQGEPQRQLSKEFVREWLISEGFQGLEGQEIPSISDEKVNEISHRYIELYEAITGKKFVKPSQEDITSRIRNNTTKCLEKLGY